MPVDMHGRWIMMKNKSTNSQHIISEPHPPTAERFAVLLDLHDLSSGRSQVNTETPSRTCRESMLRGKGGTKDIWDNFLMLRCSFSFKMELESPNSSQRPKGRAVLLCLSSHFLS